MDRQSESAVKRAIIISRGIYRLVKDLLNNRITLKQALLVIEGRLLSRPKLNDDFNWDRYHLYYQQELISTGKFHTLLPQAGDFEFSEHVIKKNNPLVQDLHPNHQLLYEIILNINPKSILEVGCGGGDHLRNLKFFNPEFNALGADRSEEQIRTLKQRHPTLNTSISLNDITIEHSALPRADLAYTQAVLMHISETNNRLRFALNNILQAANSHIVLLENWTQHNFLIELRESINQSPGWENSEFYFVTSLGATNVRALILSKTELQFEKLLTYDQLLQGEVLRTH